MDKILRERLLLQLRSWECNRIL